MSRVKYYPIEFIEDEMYYSLCIDDHSSNLDSFKALTEFFKALEIPIQLGAGDDHWISVSVVKDQNFRFLNGNTIICTKHHFNE